MFPWEIFSKFLVISETFISWASDFVSDSPKTDYLIPVSINAFLKMHSPIIFNLPVRAGCPSFSPQPKFYNVFNLFFNLIYFNVYIYIFFNVFTNSWRIFVCVDYLTQTGSPQPTFLMTYSWLIFVCVDCLACAKWLSRPLNQRFTVTYALLIFVCVDCPLSCLCWCHQF